MAFGIMSKKLSVEQKIRNWLTYKLRECITKQERFAHDKPGIDNERQIKIKFNKEIAKEITYNYFLYRKDNKLEIFYSIFNCKKEIITIEEEKIRVIDILQVT